MNITTVFLRTVVILGAVISLLSANVGAQSEGFTVSGEVTFTKTGDITLRLMTREQHKKSREDTDDKEGGEESKKAGLTLPLIKM